MDSASIIYVRNKNGGSDQPEIELNITLTVELCGYALHEPVLLQTVDSCCEVLTDQPAFCEPKCKCKRIFLFVV